MKKEKGDGGRKILKNLEERLRRDEEDFEEGNKDEGRRKIKKEEDKIENRKIDNKEGK